MCQKPFIYQISLICPIGADIKRLVLRPSAAALRVALFVICATASLLKPTLNLVLPNMACLPKN